MSLEQTILSVIKNSNSTIISYIDDKTFPISKAMLKPRKQDGLHTFWFSTNTSSNKVKFFQKNPNASLYFMNQSFYKGVSLIGTIEVLENIDDKKELWCAGDELYYPKGVNDPDYCVLKFTTIKGRFYSEFQSQDFEI